VQPGVGGTYWDGLFSQNPPVRELTDAGPDEIWVIQINPKELETEPRTVLEIADRRNELSGNLSLYQELHYIEKIDQLLEEGARPQLAAGFRRENEVPRLPERSHRPRLPTRPAERQPRQTTQRLRIEKAPRLPLDAHTR
jgi:predicted acylesterase/phospholipase RssA